MRRERKHKCFEHRAVVDHRAEPDALARALEEHFARAPTERVWLARPFGVGYRPEPPWYLAVAFGALLGGGILGHLLASHAPRVSLAADALALLLDGASLAAALGLALGLMRRTEFVAEGTHLVRRDWLGSRLLRARRLDAEDLTAALVVGASGRRSVTLVGPRNIELARAYREAFIDPPGLARWLAEALALVASRAATRR